MLQAYYIFEKGEIGGHRGWGGGIGNRHSTGASSLSYRCNFVFFFFFFAWHSTNALTELLRVKSVDPDQTDLYEESDQDLPP